MDRNPSFSEVKTVHGAGFVQIAHDKSGQSNKLITCGSDDKAYLWNSGTLLGSTQPEKYELSDQAHPAIGWHGDDVFIGAVHTDPASGIEKQIIAKLSLGDLSAAPSSYPLSFSLDVTCVDVSTKFIIGGSSDFKVKQLARGEDKAYSRYDLDGQILSVSIDPKEEFFAVATCDGVVTVFPTHGVEGTSNSESDPVATIRKLFAPFSDIDEQFPRVSLCWSADGAFLYVPSTGMVKRVRRGEWTAPSLPLNVDGWEEEVYSVCALSPDGEYLVASTVSSKIAVWRLDDMEVVAKADYRKMRPATICSVAFLPENPRHVVIADTKEGICLMLNVLPELSQGIDDLSDDEIIENTTKKQTRRMVESDDEEEEDERRNPFIDDAEEDETTRMSAVSTGSIAAIKRRYGYGDEEKEGTGDNDADGEGDLFGDIDNRDAAPHSIKPRSASPPRPSLAVREYVPPSIPSYFPSSSSPNHLTTRYLKWNAIGTVKLYESEGDSSIEIHFHDTSIHSEILLPNTETAYCLADVNEYAVALANKNSLKEQSQLLVLHLKAWESNSERWTTELPKGERPVDVAVSSSLIVLLSQTRLIRIFSHSGVQRHIVSHPSPMVSLAVRDERIAIVSVSGGAMFTGHDEEDAEFPLSVTEYRLSCSRWWQPSTSSSLSSSSCPISITPSSKLMWLSYTNRGSLVTADTKGIVRLLVSPSSSLPFWSPIFDGRSSLNAQSDTIWPIGVTEAPKREIRYVYCRGTRYPLANLPLVPIINSWSAPFCNYESDKSKQEEELLFTEMALVRDDKTDHKDLLRAHVTSIVKLFALACKAERETRAAEMATMVASAKDVQALANYAAKQRRNGLLEKVSSIGRSITEDEDAKEQAAWTASSRLNSSSRSTFATPSFEPSSVGKVLQKKMVKRQSTIISSQNSYLNDSIFESSMVSADDDDMQTREELEEPSSSWRPPIMPMDNGTPRNPFKRTHSPAPHDSSSLSVFEELDAPHRKKLKESQNITAQVRSPCQKQGKLQFGASNGVQKKSPFNLWLGENEERLRVEFVGEEEDFNKYCTQAFRMLSASHKKEWKDKAAV